MPRIESFESRFWKKVDKHSPEECWIWTATKLPRGYGIIGRGGRENGYRYAHRASYEMHKGAIPDGLLVCHKCDNPSCVNPNHLFLGTQQDNVLDKVRKGRQPVGENHKNSILTKEIVKAIRDEYAGGKTSLSILGKKYGIVFQHVHDIVTNKIWRVV